MTHPWMLLLVLLPCAVRAQTASPWELEPSETTADLRGVHAVGGGVVWASGTNGTVLRSQDSGFEWPGCAVPPGAEKLDFRAVWAWDDQTAVVMSSGPGALSRLYKTTDGCAHWTLLLTNPDQDGFLDALLFVDRQRGLVIGDPSHSRPSIRILATGNGGTSWIPVSAPPRTAIVEPGTYLKAFSDEALFAASNTAAVASSGLLWIGTNHARVLKTEIGPSRFASTYCNGAIDPISGRCSIPWTGFASVAAPLLSGSTAGIFSLDFRNANHGLAAGGDYAKPSERAGIAAWTSDGGQHWTASTTPPRGYRSAVAWDADPKLWITVGPNGSDFSRDDGKTWAPLEHAPPDAPKGGEWNALSLPWAVGPHGRIGKLNPEALPK